MKNAALPSLEHTHIYIYIYDGKAEFFTAITPIFMRHIVIQTSV